MRKVKQEAHLDFSTSLPPSSTEENELISISRSHAGLRTFFSIVPLLLLPSQASRSCVVVGFSCFRRYASSTSSHRALPPFQYIQFGLSSDVKSFSPAIAWFKMAQPTQSSDERVSMVSTVFCNLHPRDKKRIMSASTQYQFELWVIPTHQQCIDHKRWTLYL
jgi:hypothetical protein